MTHPPKSKNWRGSHPRLREALGTVGLVAPLMLGGVLVEHVTNSVQMAALLVVGGTVALGSVFWTRVLDLTIKQESYAEQVRFVTRWSLGISLGLCLVFGSTWQEQLPLAGAVVLGELLTYSTGKIPALVRVRVSTQLIALLVVWGAALSLPATRVTSPVAVAAFAALSLALLGINVGLALVRESKLSPSDDLRSWLHSLFTAPEPPSTGGQGPTPGRPRD